MYGAKTPEDIETRLNIYEDVRRKRASAIQILSNVGQDQSQLVKDEILQYMSEDEIPSTFFPALTDMRNQDASESFQTNTALKRTPKKTTNATLDTMLWKSHCGPCASTTPRSNCRLTFSRAR